VFDVSKVNFLRDVVPLIGEDVKSPFIVVPDHFVELEVSLGFFVLSSEIFLEYGEFPSSVLIPQFYHVVASMTYTLTFWRMGRRFALSRSLNWFLHGMIWHSSKSYQIAALGENGVLFYEWALARYLWRFKELNEQFQDPCELPVYKWVIRQPMHINASFEVH
jgi:hypothetical protein